MATSWIQAAVQFGFELRLACPEPLAPPPAVLAWARGQGAKITVTTDVAAAVRGADCVVTDIWVSMGDEPVGNLHHNLLAQLPRRRAGDGDGASPMPSSCTACRPIAARR